MPAGSQYQTVNLSISGPSYQSRSIPLSSQRSYNLYPDVSAGDAMSPVVMYSWPGLEIANVDFFSPEIIGCYVFNGEFYAVSGVTVRKYSSDLSSFVELGDIDATPFRKTSISDNGQVMVIVAGASAWECDGSTVTKIPSVTLSPTVVQFLNERFYLNGDDGGTSVSDVLSTNFDSGNVFYGRSTPQPTIVHHIFNQIVYLFDESSIEPWNDVSAGAPPVARINQGIIEGVGCSSLYGITSTSNYMYFIGSDSHAYRVKGFRSEEITTPSIANYFRGLNVGECSVDQIDIQGHKFVMFHFLGDDECWVFSESSSQWFEVGNESERYQPISPVFYANRWVCGDRSTGSLFEFSPDYVFNGSSLFVRERIIATLSGDDVGQPGTMLEMSKLRISMETGAANPSISKQPAEVMVVPSFDGGYTWSKPIVVSIGRAGDFTKPVEIHMMQQFRRAVFKIRMTDLYGTLFGTDAPALAIFSASIDVRGVPF